MSAENGSGGSITEALVVITALGSLTAATLWMIRDYAAHTTPAPQTCEDALAAPTAIPTATPIRLPAIRVEHQWIGDYRCVDTYSPHKVITQFGNLVVEGVEPVKNPCPFRVHREYDLISCRSTNRVILPP